MTVQEIEVRETRQQGIARRVRGLMGEQRINGTRVGQAIHVSNVAVSRRLQSHVEFTPSEVEALAELFAVDEAYLYGFSDVRHQGLEPRTRWFTASEAPPAPLSAVEHLADVLPFRARLPHVPRRPRPRVGQAS